MRISSPARSELPAAAVAVTIGALMVTLIEPGSYVDSSLIAGLGPRGSRGEGEGEEVTGPSPGADEADARAPGEA